MIVALAISGAVVTIVAALALILPCPACEKRRQRMREAYAKWQAEKARKS